ncbi:MAG: 50S ribosomal protein L23 [Bacteroidota bacterium]|nr:50S ribosomal protein L23 [Bacteroidota bacterium]
MSIIIKPLITEKMTKINEKDASRCAFIVDKRANKIEIKKAIEDLYSVKVDSVNTMNYSGKKKARFTKAGYIQGRTNAFKKAMITLAKGETIDFFSNI